MSKAVQTDYSFDVAKFTELLNLAKGQRKQSEFASDCGLSLAYVCKYLNGKFDNPPTPSTISKIASVSGSNVSEEDLLRAAGYDPAKYVGKRQERVAQMKEKMNRALSVIKNTLFNVSFSWSPKVISKQTAVSDFSITINGSSIEEWLFEYVPYNTDMGSIESSFHNQIVRRYGLLAANQAIQSKHVKFSIVVDSREFAERVKASSPLFLDMVVSVILIDDVNLELIEETVLSSAATFMDDSIMLIASNE